MAETEVKEYEAGTQRQKRLLFVFRSTLTSPLAGRIYDDLLSNVVPFCKSLEGETRLFYAKYAYGMVG